VAVAAAGMAGEGAIAAVGVAAHPVPIDAGRRPVGRVRRCCFARTLRASVRPVCIEACGADLGRFRDCQVTDPYR
jgi:hypothetical protein